MVALELAFKSVRDLIQIEIQRSGHLVEGNEEGQKNRSARIFVKSIADTIFFAAALSHEEIQT